MNRTLQISLTLLYSKFSKYFELLEMPYLEKKAVLRYSLSFAPTLVSKSFRGSKPLSKCIYTGFTEAKVRVQNFEGRPLRPHPRKMCRERKEAKIKDRAYADAE